MVSFEHGNGHAHLVSWGARYAVLFAGEAHAALIRAALPGSTVTVTNRADFLLETAKPDAVAFVDSDLFHLIDGVTTNAPIVAIIDDTLSSSLTKTIRSLESSPWLSHVIVASLLSNPMARSHLTSLLDLLPHGPDQSMVGGPGIGRVALLARASRRGARFDRMREFFSKHELSHRTIATITEVAEELVTNALYDAPVEAGYFEHAIPRTEDVELPLDRACEISYGIEYGDAFVRVRDTFGALKRDRLLEVLNRCNASSVALDESRGGAGLGMWRVFSTATTLSIAVIPDRVTDIRIGFATKDGRIGKQLLAVHLFFAREPAVSEAPAAPHVDRELDDDSVTLMRFI
ncbi:MAG: hypothetical protein H6Q90_1331 [Deltaproteobacteria bacterium]|nr:hypothetical protein [Deltaproteobacteria bacterium]